LPLELGESDAVVYRFLNDGKPVSLSLAIPPSILATIDGSRPIGFISDQGNFHSAIIDVIKFNLEVSDPELIETTIECKTRVASFDTPFAIEPLLNSVSEDIASAKFKAYFDKNTSGLTQIDFELYYPLGRTTNGPYAPFTSTGVIKQSTDERAGGGTITFLPVVDYDHASGNDIELRIRKGAPKYIVENGIVRNFIQGSGFWYIKALTFGNAFKPLDAIPVWIVF
jgi:hypothetical protein